MGQPFESEISKCISSVLGAKPAGTLVVDADEGDVGTSGSFESGFLRRTRIDVLGLPDDLYELIEKAHEASKAHPGGPWYRCEISVDPREGFKFNYFWLADALMDLNSIPRGSLGGLPGGVLRARFDGQVIARLEDHEISGAILGFVASERSAGNTVRPTLLDLYGVADWHGDSNNGSLNQYFARTRDPYGGLERSELYGATLRGLEAIKHVRAVAHFREALAVYAHIYDRVSDACERLEVASIGHPEELPVVDDYWVIEKQIHSLISAYVRANVADLSGG